MDFGGVPGLPCQSGTRWIKGNDHNEKLMTMKKALLYVADRPIRGKGAFYPKRYQCRRTDRCFGRCPHAGW
jgi:hypothetical protein